MKNFFKKLKALFGRGRELREEISSIKAMLEAERKLNEENRRELEEFKKAIEERLSSIEAEKPDGITARQLLNEYIYGENGDE